LTIFGRNKAERLRGKTIIVAGCGGIGDGLARRYAAEGARVDVGDIDEQTAKSMADKIPASGGCALAVQLDGAGDGLGSVDRVHRAGHLGGGRRIHAPMSALSPSAMRPVLPLCAKMEHIDREWLTAALQMNAPGANVIDFDRRCHSCHQQQHPSQAAAHKIARHAWHCGHDRSRHYRTAPVDRLRGGADLG
jgi:hypothetical protein